MIYLHYLTPILVSLAYVGLGSIRIAIFIPILFLIAILFEKRKQVTNIVFILTQCFLLAFMFSYALITSYYNNFLAFLIFFILSTMYSFFGLNKSNLDKLLKIYVFSVIFSAFGLFFQYILYNYMGLSFGTILYFNNRTAFSFSWLDFSFFSLYLVSAIPLLFYVFKSIYVRSILSLILIVASFMTTARTGIFSIGIFFIFWVFYTLFKVLYLNKISLEYVKYLFFTPLILLFVYILYPIISTLSNRDLTSNDSGRFGGYVNAYNYIQDNFIFGAKFDSANYYESIGVLPHNLFIYIFTMGGVVYFLIFLIFIFMIFKYFKNTYLLSAIIISLIGSMFIPSFYSMYYFAWLVSMSIAYFNCAKLESFKSV